MSYSKTTWKTGDTITAQLLNHAEDGIAANDAAIAAIPAGLQLYGPYYGFATATVTAGNTEYIDLDNYEILNGSTVTFPNPNDGGETFVSSVVTSGGAVTGFSAPMIQEGLSGKEWNAAQINVYNDSSESGSYEVSMLFYSTVEFPMES